MPTVTTTVVVANGTDALFRAWGSAVSAALAAVGMVKTADTGQVDWATAVSPAVNTSVYEVWRFNDSSQSTSPIFFRVNYGTGSNAAYPQLSYVFGTGSNGSGVITKPRASRVSTSAPTSTTVPTALWVSSDGSYLNLFFGPLANANPVRFPFSFLSIDRFRGESGDPTSDGFHVLHSIWSGSTAMGPGYNNSSPSYSIFSSNYSANRADWSPDAPGVPSPLGSSTFGTGSQGSSLYSVLPVVFAPGGYYVTSWIPMHVGDTGLGAEFSASPFGASITFKSLGSAINTATTTSQSTVESNRDATFPGLAMRWG